MSRPIEMNHLHMQPCWQHKMFLGDASLPRWTKFLSRGHAFQSSCVRCIQEDVTLIPTDSTRRKGGRRERRLWLVTISN